MLRQWGREIFRVESRLRKAEALPCCPITEWETGRNETFQDSTRSEDTVFFPLPLDHRGAPEFVGCSSGERGRALGLSGRRGSI